MSMYDNLSLLKCEKEDRKWLKNTSCKHARKKYNKARRKERFEYEIYDIEDY